MLPGGVKSCDKGNQHDALQQYIRIDEELEVDC